MTKTLLSAKTSPWLSPTVLGTSLKDVLDFPLRGSDYNLVRLLVEAGADVYVAGSQCIQHSARSANVELLKLLIRHNDHGAYGLSVDQALVDATRLGSDEVALIQLLLKAKASTSHRGGKPLSNAVKFCSKDIVHSIITKEKHQQSRLAALPWVFNPPTPGIREKAELVIQGGIDQENINKALIHELSNGKSIDHNMVKMLLCYKAKCDYGHGKALDLAIESGDSALLQLLLASPPNPRLLAQKILVAMQITERKRKCGIVALLLQVGAEGPEVLDTLIRETRRSTQYDTILIKLLVEHGADITRNSGEVVRTVVLSPARLDLLKLILGATDASKAATAASFAIRSAMENQDPIRQQALISLLGSGAHAVLESPPARPIIQLLLQHGASANFDSGRAITSAVQQGYLATLGVLLNAEARMHHVAPAAFKNAMRLPQLHHGSSAPLRLPIIKLLTQVGVQASQSGDGAFIQAIKEQDHELLAHLIQRGGDAEFGDGDAILVATDLYDIDSLRLLAKRIHNPEVYSKAFTKVMSKRERWQNSRGFLEFAKVLLNGGASGPAVDQALIEAIASDEAYIADQFVCAHPEPASTMSTIMMAELYKPQ